jgi:hypothetical protein
LHHAGDDEAGSGDANEGITFVALQKAARQQAFPSP